MKKALLATLVLTAVAASTLSLTADASTDKQVLKNEEGIVHTVIGQLGKAKGASPETRALDALEQVKTDFGYDTAAGQFKLQGTHKDESGTTHTKLDRIINGIPVYGQQLIVHENDGDIQSVTGNYAALTPNDAATKLNATQAIKKAIVSTGYTGELTATPQATLVYVPQGDQAIISYLITINYLAEEPGHWTIFVNAVDGSILQAVNEIETATGTGTGVLGDTKSINTTLKNGQYYLEDQTKNMYTQKGSTINTYSFNNGTRTQYYMTDSDNVWSTSTQRAGVDAHYYAGKVYDFYNSELGRNSYDNNGASIISGVHYSKNYNNAFWNGSQMVYGDGDGTQFISLSGGLDVIAHELMHAVTETTSGLNYQNQSGALNESWSDAMACVIDSDDWLIGEDVYTPGTPGDALRSLADPTLYGQPDHMSGYVSTTSDNGGVHTNSGIPNKAFYNFATSIGSRSIAGKVWYTADRDYMTASTDFSGARAATLQAVAALYGTSSSYYSALQSAWSAVGVN